MSLLNDSNFEQVIKSGISVVKFSSLWGIESRAVEQPFRELSEEFKGKARFIVSDINANQLLARKEDITDVPTIQVYVNGVSVTRVNGMTKRSLRETIEQVVRKYGNSK